MEDILYRELLIANEQGTISKEESRALVIEIQNRWLEERNQAQDKLSRRNMQIKALKAEIKALKQTK
jgi:polyhydroxyalkanoate synthesis regulator phasin